MTIGISGFGGQVNLQASKTFPQGLQISQFADDSDPVDVPSVQIGDKAMGVNGDLVTWVRANPIVLTLAVIAGSDDDINLSVLANANRAGRSKLVAYDSIQAVVVYPDGTTTTLVNGVITDAMFSKSIASAGRLKSKTYTFAFESMVNT